MFMRTWFSVDIFSLKVLSLHDEYRKSVFCRMICKTDQKLSQFGLNWRIQCLPICWFCCEINLKNIQKFSNLHHDMSRLNFYFHASVTFTLMVFFISTWITSTMNASSKINNNAFWTVFVFIRHIRLLSFWLILKRALSGFYLHCQHMLKWKIKLDGKVSKIQS